MQALSEVLGAELVVGLGLEHGLARQSADPHRGRDPDQRRAADPEALDRLLDVGHRAQLLLDAAGGQLGLIEDDDGVADLRPADLLGRLVA